jgi:AcrR family transcriptional regulator
MKSMTNEREAERRRQILDAALATFLQFGYAKTSLEDIANRAHLSRPLIYRKFRNKDEILAAVFQRLFEGRYERASEIIASRANKREKLLQLCEILYLEPYDLVTSTPMAAQLYDACDRVDPAGAEKRNRLMLKYAQAVLGAKDVAEVFLLAGQGLSSDIPATNVLRRRIETLVERFI